MAARDPHFHKDHGIAHHRPDALLLFEADEPDHVEDVTGFVELEYLSDTLRKQGAELVLAGRSTESDEILRAKGMDDIRMVDRHFPTMRQAIKAYRSTHPVTRP